MVHKFYLIIIALLIGLGKQAYCQSIVSQDSAKGSIVLVVNIKDTVDQKLNSLYLFFMSAKKNETSMISNTTTGLVKMPSGYIRKIRNSSRDCYDIMSPFSMSQFAKIYEKNKNVSDSSLIKDIGQFYLKTDSTYISYIDPLILFRAQSFNKLGTYVISFYVNLKYFIVLYDTKIDKMNAQCSYSINGNIKINNKHSFYADLKQISFSRKRKLLIPVRLLNL